MNNFKIRKPCLQHGTITNIFNLIASLFLALKNRVVNKIRMQITCFWEKNVKYKHYFESIFFIRYSIPSIYWLYLLI